jgi:hypothetical protein
LVILVAYLVDFSVAERISWWDSYMGF